MDITNNNVKEEKTNSVPHNVLVPECLAKKADRFFLHNEKEENVERYVDKFGNIL